MRVKTKVGVRLGHIWPVALLSVAAVLGLAAKPAHQELSTDQFMKHVGFLASDDMNGRGNGTPELDRAAKYIAAEFESYGLVPFGQHESFLQEFPITVDAMFGHTQAVWIEGENQQAGSDFVTLSLSTSGTYTGPVVFAGYGITAPQVGWDDYAGIDVAGKAVVVFTYLPTTAMASARPLGPVSSFEMKARNAKAHGARAILFVRDPDVGKGSLIGINTQHIVPHDMGLLAMYVSPSSIEPWFKKLGMTIVDVKRRIDTTLRPASFELGGSSMRATTEMHRTTTTATNVFAAIPGTDAALRNEWLIIGAHYDHLGRGRAAPAGGRQPHYGADDNASGTAGLLELARTLARDRASLKRSIMFVAFSGEEVGLIGSSHFVEHAPVPLASVTAMLNLDMIGRLSNKPLSIMGSHAPWLADAIRRENHDIGLTLTFSQGDSASSDWAAFQAKGVPSLTFFTGMHRDYHQPSDTADKINALGAIKVLSIVDGTVRRIVGNEFTRTRGQSSQTLPADDDEEAFFGAEPVFHEGLNALRLAYVPKGSPAEKAGLRFGDVVVELGEFPVRTLSDFRSTLQSFLPGDMPAVVVRRQGRPIRVAVVLERRIE